MNLIGLMGDQGAGKDSVARILGEMLRRSHSHQMHTTAFGKALKAEVADAFGMGPQTAAYYLNGEKTVKDTPCNFMKLSNCRDMGFVHKVYGISGVDYDALRSPREILQNWGTEYRRAQDQQYWVDKVDEEITNRIVHHRDHHPMGQLVIAITDVRFENEYEMVKEHSGHAWRVNRGEEDLSDGHYSEVEWRNIIPDAVIKNDGDLQDLHQATIDTFMALRDLSQNPIHRS